MLPFAPAPLFPGAKVHRMSFCFFTFIRSRYPTALDDPVKLIQYLLQNISIITLRMKHDESISMLTIVRPLTPWELPGRGEQVMSDVRLYVSHTVFLPACAEPPYILIAASAAIPSRTPHPAPRNLENEVKEPSLGEANPRIPYETQAKVITNCLVPHLYSRRISAAPSR